MNGKISKRESAALAKIATGPWNMEYTPELGIAFHLALENYGYNEALAAVGVLLKQADRSRAIDPGEIVGQIQAERKKQDPSRRYFTAKDQDQGEANPLTIEQRRDQITALKEKFPDLFTEVDRRSSKIKRGFDEGCSD